MANKPCVVNAVLSALVIFMAFLDGAAIRFATILAGLMIFTLSVRGECPEIFMKPGKKADKKK